MRISDGSSDVCSSDLLSVTAFVQWALGPNGTRPAPFVATSLDGDTGALLATNAWLAEFGERVAFIDLRGRQASHDGDRLGFLGRHGDLSSPPALRHGPPLAGRTGGSDERRVGKELVRPCSARWSPSSQQKPTLHHTSLTHHHLYTHT